MTKSPNQDIHSPCPIRKRLWLLVLKRGSIALGGLLLLGVIVGIWRLWTFVETELTPLAQESLTTTLNRPVKLGKVTKFSLTGVQFGASAIPATPTDADRAAVESVEVGFDLLQLIFNRHLKLDVTLVNPDIYIDQDDEGRWVSTSIASSGKDGAIKTDLDYLRFRNAKLALMPDKRVEEAGEAGEAGGVISSASPTSPITFSQLNGSAQLLANNQLIRFDVGGQADSGGNISIQGETRSKVLAGNFQLQAQDFFAADITRLIKLPVNLQAGRANGDLSVRLTPGQQTLLYGNAAVQGVTLQIPKVPQLLSNSQGNLRFQGTELQLNNVTTNYGKIPVVATGIIDTQAGFKLSGRVNAVSLANAQDTLKVKLPVPIAGQVQADLLITGSTKAPILSGSVNTIQTARIDKVDFNNISSKFELVTSSSSSLLTLKDIQGKAKVGGDITGVGTIQLGKTPRIDLNFAAKNVPGDAIAKVYETTPAFQIGNVSGTAQLIGASTNVQTLVQFQAPNGTYPGTGEVAIAPNRNVSFRNVALNVSGGTVRATGSYIDQRWQAVAVASRVKLEPFVDKSQLQNVSLAEAQFNGRLILSGSTAPFEIATIRTDGAGVQIGGGTVAVSNVKLQDQGFSAQLVANGVRLGQILKQSPPALNNPLAGTFQIAGSRDNFSLKTLRGNGEGSLAIGGGTVTAKNIQLADGVYQAQVQAKNVAVQELASVPKQFTGALSGQFDVAGSVDSFKPETIQASGQARVNVAGGTITASNIQLANGVYQAQVQAKNVPVRQLAAVPPQFRGTLTGQVNVAGSVESFQAKAIQAIGQARVNVAGGTITASNIQLANGVYQAQVQANNVPLQQLAAVPPQFRGTLTGEANVAGSVESFQPQTIQANGQGRLDVAGGTIAASNIQLANGRYQAVVNASGVELNRFNPQLRGQFGGQLQLAGTVGSSKLADVRAAGQVQLSQGIPGLEQPLTAAIAWSGERLTIERATAPGLSVTGNILANAKKAGIPEITALNLNVQAQNYNLKQLPINLPNQVAVAGSVDFNGQITGKLPLPNVVGQINLRDLVVQDIAFEPLLTGNIDSAQGRGLSLNLAGNSDRLAFNLDANNRPKSFLVKWQEASATGNVQGNDWALKVANFPLQIFNLTPPPITRLGAGKIAGLLTGDLLFNQQTLAATGNLAIANPQIGWIKGDRLAAQFRYDNGKATLTSSEFIKGKSSYALVGTFAQSPKGPQLQGKLNVSQGEIQDVLTVAQIFDLQNLPGGSAEIYGTAEDLTTTPQGVPNQPLLTQIQRFSEIETLVEEQEEQRLNSTPIPDLADLKGTFNGEVAVNTATANGLSVDFNLNGQNFAWGKKEERNRYYTADKVIAEGNFENGVLSLRPLRLESENRLIAFTGNVGGDEQSGQFRVNNFPLQLLNNFVKLPVGITGNLNGTAAIAGSIANPQARGELQITEGLLNQKAIESARASFSYANGRLNFGSSVAIAGPKPVDINGSIPYKLPFASVAPDNDQINLDMKLENEGLGLLNALTNQVVFEKGEGEIDLKVRGTLQKPEVQGIATVNDATFSAQALPGKLRGVTGKVLFNFDRILVENLQGRFSRGKVQAAGEIPIFNNQNATIDNPLTVDLEQLALNLKGLYQGGASGNLQITGSALNPVIGGKVNLFDGQVLLAESTNTDSSTNSSLGVSPTKENKQGKDEIGNGMGNGIAKFNNLDLELGKNVQITRPPILNFRATGNLIVNGFINQPIPDGTIRLEKGGVNLFTTQFNLARGYKHTATFSPSQPRDPNLDIRLFAKVLDVTQSNDFSRINSTGLSALESVRVEATINGLASKLNDNLELTSSPSRSQTEIVALLGGGFVDTQGRGDSTLGLINIAGSAVFNNFQSAFNQIGSTFGLSELRIFPTVISENPEAGRSSSTLELAAEAGVDISSKISVSSIKILTTNDPFQWGVNYRINDEFRVRASTNLTDDSRAVVEYQTRF
ncbi:MAG: translocation/assembly module TamB domain-containing protein [Nostoc sp. DedVER02]|uniref:translocation/assembly module TamB domain-containing protein n=1 Tax=unclassified Nostoc TaxID=2593658 RepID=UPI002AD38769|nr:MULTISPECIES: translocation/assembly module TamB domain-containing protein [unclassified Nostoc]MDZ7987891.1 translocation/assembly module TamB domain-containing protein [Nostoc sp. DedVER02]MDZ8114552.1 translocation/assembly module TamB domain-containing protein [Nostoc sp. DedVER01b]